jgi:pimeloyl-ACP methyl ester carboxylesterase
VVAISPSGISTPVERVYQCMMMTTRRLLLRGLRGVIAPSARSTLGRSVLSSGMRAAPWQASQAEAQALAFGIAEADDFWNMLWWAVLVDMPGELHKIDVPVVLAEGTTDLLTGGQTARYLPLIPRATFVPLWGAGHAPHSDAPHATAALVRRATAASAIERPVHLSR